MAWDLNTPHFTGPYHAVRYKLRQRFFIRRSTKAGAELPTDSAWLFPEYNEVDQDIVLPGGYVLGWDPPLFPGED